MIDKLGVCNLKQLGYKLFGPVLSIKIAAQHREVEGLNLIEVC